ncbi:MAG TPA: hypothetical protein VLK89_08280 [Solirubrobacterales bacterium]|nr:hypothetical protein [Solirubrobacterales bacterium]
MYRIRKVLTFSNVVACLALFLALGGTVYAAGKISGKQVKAGSLPGNRIKPKTITANRIKPKVLTGNQVKANSLTGKQINQSTLTGVSAAALASVQYMVETVPLSATSDNGTTALASCPPSTYVIGGGATVSNEERAFVNDSGPDPLRTGWSATGFSRFSQGNRMTVTAICVPVEKPANTAHTVTGVPEYHSAG